jgi:hypothetical protein
MATATAIGPSPSSRVRAARIRLAVPVLLAVLIVAPLWHIHLINREMAPEKADMVPIWIAARVALAGGNPYSADATRQIQIAYYGRPLRPSDNVNKMTYAYPAHTLVILSVLTPFTWPVLRLALFILLPAITAASVILWLRVVGVTLNKQRSALVVLCAVLSWPAMWAIRLAQPTLVVAFLVAAGCFLLTRNYPWAAGLLLAMSTMKPQLVGPLIAWLCVWSLLRRQWRFLVSFSLSLTGLIACASHLVPGWIPEWRVAMADFLAYRHLKLDLVYLLGGPVGLLLTATLVVAAIVALWRGILCDPHSPLFGTMCALALAVALVTQPTDMTMLYNHVLLFPACLILVFRKPESPLGLRLHPFAIAQLVLDYVAVPIAVLGQIFFKPLNFFTVLPFMDYLLPSLLTLMLASEAIRSAAPVVARGLGLNIDAAHGQDTASCQIRSSATIPALRS